MVVIVDSVPILLLIVESAQNTTFLHATEPTKTHVCYNIEIEGSKCFNTLQEFSMARRSFLKDLWEKFRRLVDSDLWGQILYQSIVLEVSGAPRLCHGFYYKVAEGHYKEPLEIRCGSAGLGILGAGFQPDKTKIASILGKWKLFCAYWLQFCLNFQFLTRPVWQKISKDICCCNKFRKIKADKEH